MKDNKFVLSGAQSHTLEMAMNRPENCDWTPELIHKMTQGNNLGEIRQYLLGRAEFRKLVPVIDFGKPSPWKDRGPFIPLESHVTSRIKSLWDFDPSRIELHQTPSQKGKVDGYQVRRELEGMRVCGDQLLDFYMANPDLIPCDWQGKQVMFWGSIYGLSGGREFVRSLRYESKVEDDTSNLVFAWGPDSGIPRFAVCWKC